MRRLWLWPLTGIALLTQALLVTGVALVLIARVGPVAQWVLGAVLAVLTLVLIQLALSAFWRWWNGP